MYDNTGINNQRRGSGGELCLSSAITQSEFSEIPLLHRIGNPRTDGTAHKQFIFGKDRCAFNAPQT